MILVVEAAIVKQRTFGGCLGRDFMYVLGPREYWVALGRHMKLPVPLGSGRGKPRSNVRMAMGNAAGCGPYGIFLRFPTVPSTRLFNDPWEKSR